MTRSVSLDLRALAPGDYVVMPSTFEKGHEMDFYMRFYCSQDIDLAPINTPLTVRSLVCLRCVCTHSRCVELCIGRRVLG